MTESSAPAAAAAPSTESRASRKRLVLARTLTVVGILVLVISVLANFVKRSALDKDRFQGTSQALIADPVIQQQIAATLTDALYSNVDVEAALQAKLPTNLQPLAGAIAGTAREAIQRSAQRLLQRPRAQAAFVAIAAGTQSKLIDVLDGHTERLSTTNGNVTLDLRPLVVALGARFSFLQNLASQIPPDKAQVTILQSDQLSTAQNLTQALRFVAAWIWALALLCWAAAIWLARGRRRVEVRAIAIGVIVAGLLVLVVRTVAGRYLVHHLVKNDSVRPAAQHAYDILTTLLRGAGWTALIIGVVALFGVWIAGPGRRATAWRRALAPHLARPWIAYGTLAVAYLLLLWWRPTPQFGFWINIALFAFFAVVGLEALRRQTRREFPHVEPGESAAAAWEAISVSAPKAANGGTADQLARLAELHDSGALDDAEYATAKSQLLGVGAP